MNGATKINSEPAGGNQFSEQLVDAKTLLVRIFPEKCRPTLRWLREQQKLRRVPFVKIGKLVFFDPTEVRAAWRDRFTVGQANGGAR